MTIVAAAWWDAIAQERHPVFDTSLQLPDCNLHSARSADFYNVVARPTNISHLDPEQHSRTANIMGRRSASQDDHRRRPEEDQVN